MNPRGIIGSLFGSIRWEFFLVWPLVLVLVYAGFFAHSRLLAKGFNELLAPIILGAATVVMLVRWLGERQPLVLILTVLDATFLCRELHFAGTTQGVYVALLLLGVWAVYWWPNLRTDLRDNGTTPYLLFAFLTYVVSQAIARRAFRHILPLEATSDVFRTGLEEVFENLAHLAMLLVAIRGFPRTAGDEERSARATRPTPHCGSAMAGTDREETV